MKIALNRCFGGFGLSEEFKKATGFNDWTADRTDPAFVAAIENFSGKVDNDLSDIHIFNIPDDATDWEMDDYDGIESIVYVQNGKLYHI